MSDQSDAELLRQTILFYDIEQRRILAEHGPVTQARMLAILLRHGALAQSDLGRKLGLEKSWISRAVDKLVEQGWVARSANAQDRRGVLVELTDTGRDKAQQLRSNLDRHAQDVLARLSPAGRDAVLTGMRALASVVPTPETPTTRSAVAKKN
ncbi:MAG: MarR family transcriptional regulator [Rhodocyclaceae bacterium]